MSRKVAIRPKRAKPGDRPKKDRRRMRELSPFSKHSTVEINREIEQAYPKVLKKQKIWGDTAKITKTDAESCYQKYRGRCAMCDARVCFLGRSGLKSARLMFYVPLKYGGAPRIDNLIMVCAECKHEYRDTQIFRQDIEGLDSFADACEALFRAVKDGSDYKRVAALKARLNSRLVDVANCMRYVVKKDWIPDHDELVEEDNNTIGDHLEAMANGEDTKDEITQTAKQIVARKQYKILRNPAKENNNE